MKKLFNHILIAILLIAGFFAISPRTVAAANPQKVKLHTNKTYKAYDITGDKKKDTIRVNISKDRYGFYDSLAVKINGKIVYSFRNQYFYAKPPKYDVDIMLYTLKNGKPFLYISAEADNGDGPVCGIFQYKNGKLLQIINFQTLFEPYGAHLNGEVVSVNGNTITTKYNIMSYVLGPCYVSYNYRYKGGTLKRTSATTSFDKSILNKTFYANKTLTAYTSTKTNKKSFSVKRRAAVKVDKCYISGGKMLVRVKYKGRYGWIKAMNGYHGEANKQFSNIYYAG